MNDLTPGEQDLVNTVLKHSPHHVSAEELVELIRLYREHMKAHVEYGRIALDLTADASPAAQRNLDAGKAYREALLKLLPSPRARMEAEIEGEKPT